MIYDTSSINNSYFDIFSKITDYDIFRTYCGEFKIKKPFISPLRANDKNPSFVIYYNKSNKLTYLDYGTGESGNSISFIMKLFSLSYDDALKKISNDIFCNKVIKTNIHNNIIKNNSSSTIEISSRKFLKKDLDYWSSYGICLNTLNKFNVTCVKKIWINDKLALFFNDNEYVYAYLIYNKYKIYQPYSNEYKFITNCNPYYLQGFEQLPSNGDTLIITKSLKDVMCLHDLGFISVAPQSENNIIPENIINILKNRFKNIFVLYDRDITGIKNARKLTKLYNFNNVIINKKFNSKDISDLYKNTGMETTINFLIKNIK